MRSVVVGLIVLALPLASRSDAGPKADPIAPYVGDWVGTAWGTEVRFKQSRREFVSQLAGGRKVPGQTGEETIMALTVKHTAEFAFTVLPDGSVRGKGAIVYDLFPNLCGVAALTKQVNTAVNMMDKIPFIFQLATELGKGVVKALNADWHAKEAGLANALAGWKLDSPEGMASHVLPGQKAKMPALHIGAWLRQHEPDEVVDLAKTVIKNRCNAGKATFLSGFSCGLLGSVPVAQEVEGFGELLFGKAMDAVWEGLGDKMVEKLKALGLESQRDEARCQGGGAPGMRAGAKVGPATAGEYAQEVAPDAAKAALEMAAGGAPVGMMLSIPGVTQVQYHYKGLPNGPEKRVFAIKGRLVVAGDGARLELEQDGDVQGDKRLKVEYQVNYKTDRATFPTWSPFRKAGGRARPSGVMTLREHRQVPQKRTFRDQATGKSMTVDVPVDVTTTHRLDLNLPFATFEEAGYRRDGVKPWHDYEYYWSAIKVTSPEAWKPPKLQPGDLE